MQFDPDKYRSSGARLSHDEIYRYLLWREWGDDAEPESCLFIMLNPSTADGNVDDPTIRRCVGFAKRHGFMCLEVVNLFSYRATKPSDLFEYAKTGGDPSGFLNQKIITEAADRAGIIICAWGAQGGFINQDETVIGWLEYLKKPLYALGLTKDGKPKHPLYLPANSKLIRYR